MQLLKPTVALFLVFNLVSSMAIRANATVIEEIPRSAMGRATLRKAVIPSQEPASKGREFASYDDIEEIPHSVMGSEMSDGSELVKRESRKGIKLFYG